MRAAALVQGSTVDSLPKILRLTLAAAVIGMCLTAAPAFGADGYPRPKGASPLRSPMVPVFERCETDGGRKADSTHGAPLAFPSCTNPEQVSGDVTIGSPDANSKTANSIGYVLYTVIPGVMSTPADEADVRIDFNMSDLRVQDGLADYAGTLELSLESRITDQANGLSGNAAGTMEDFFYVAVIPCGATAAGETGGTCTLHTTMDSIVPNTIQEGKRTVWEQADHTHIFDAGPDGNALTEDDNLLFATQGVYVP
jgi:hypothetical protein